jgi:hypothetical protein
VDLSGQEKMDPFVFGKGFSPAKKLLMALSMVERA